MESLPSSTTGITSLPNEVLDKILRLVEPTTLHQCSKVSRFFYFYIHNVIGLNVKIGKLIAFKDNYFELRRGDAPLINKHMIHIPAIHIDKSKQMKLRCITVAGINSAWLSLPLRKNQEPTFLYPSLVRKLIFDNVLLSRQLTSIIQPLSNLQQLIIGQNALLHLKLAEDRIYKDLSVPRLKTLIISGKGFYKKRPRWGWAENNRQLHRMIVNILLLLRGIKFPMIRELVIQNLKIGSKKHEAVIMDSLMNCIIRHKCTLDKLSIGIAHTFLGFHAPADAQQFPPIDHLQLQSHLEGVQLQSFFVHNTRYGVHTRRSQELLNSLINIQSIGYKNTLKHFVWIFNRYGVFEASPNNIIRFNSTSLTSIEMMISPSLGEFDCTILALCESLKMLTLIGGKRVWRRESGAIVTIPHNARLTHLDSIPTSLKSFRIKNLNISVEESHFLTRDQLKLDLLDLQNIGNGVQFGMSIESFGQIMNKKDIQTISLRRAFNSNSLNNNVNVTSSALGIQLMLRQAERNVVNMKSFLLLKLINNTYEVYYPIKRCHCVLQDGYGYYNKDERSNYFKNDASQFLLSLPYLRTWRGRHHINWANTMQVLDFKTCEEIQEIKALFVKMRNNNTNNSTNNATVPEAAEANLDYHDSDDEEDEEELNSDFEMEDDGPADDETEEESEADSDDDEEINNNDMVDEGVETDDEGDASEESSDEDEVDIEGESESDDDNSSGYESD